jgi:hypothetical protein
MSDSGHGYPMGLPGPAPGWQHMQYHMAPPPWVPMGAYPGGHYMSNYGYPGYPPPSQVTQAGMYQQDATGAPALTAPMPTSTAPSNTSAMNAMGNRMGTGSYSFSPPQLQHAASAAFAQVQPTNNPPQAGPTSSMQPQYFHHPQVTGVW